MIKNILNKWIDKISEECKNIKGLKKNYKHKI